MMTLSETWFMEGNIDFESKKYTLLAYLQRINAYFNESKLYPHLSDIIFHYNNIIAFKDNKRFLQQQFPKRHKPLSPPSKVVRRKLPRSSRNCDKAGNNARCLLSAVSPHARPSPFAPIGVG